MDREGETKQTVLQLVVYRPPFIIVAPIIRTLFPASERWVSFCGMSSCDMGQMFDVLKRF